MMKIFEQIQAFAFRVKPRLFVTMLLLSTSSVAVFNSQLASAAIYKKVDADGNVSFSDVADKDAKLIIVAPLPTVSAMNPDLVARTLGTDQGQLNQARQENYSLTIISPSSDQTYNRSADAFSANVQVQPDLTNGDRLVFLVDGKATIDSNATEETDRGQHQFEAKVVNSSGRVLISKSVSFNVKQNSLTQQRMGIKY